MAWMPREPKWAWRDYLTEEEAAMIVDLERTIEHAKHLMAEASMSRGPIQNRAIQRAKYATRKQRA